MAERPGAVRLLQPNDIGKSFIGWRSVGLSVASLANTHVGLAVLRVIAQKVSDGKLHDSYDQPLFVENAAAIVVCQEGNRVAFTQNYRFVGERLLDVGAQYVRRLYDEGRFEELLATLGAWKWELPRGVSTSCSITDMQEFVLQTAKAEALEEAGLELADVRIAGRVNANSTFFAHAHYVVHGRIVGKGGNRPEASEIIGRTRLFSIEEIRALIDSGELDDGFTLSGLAICGIHF